MDRTIITMITWNRLSLTQDTLASLTKHCGKREVLVVDNGSTDGTIEWLRDSGYEVLENGENLGIFMASRRAWFEAYDRKYDFILNLQNDFPCVRKIHFDSIEKYLDDHPDVGFVQLNDKSVLKIAKGNGEFRIKKRARTENYVTGKRLKFGDWEEYGEVKIAKGNHHFSFNPNLFRSSLVPRLVGEIIKPRELQIMEKFEGSKMKSAKVKKICFDTIIRKREESWLH